MSLGSRIKGLRIKSKLTQKEVADKLGMGSSNFGHIEHDRVTPTSIDLEKIADIFNKTTDYLFGRSIVALIEDRLIELNMTMVELSEKSKIPLKNLQNLDNVQPGPWDYTKDGLIDHLSKALQMSPRELSIAFARQEPPVYDGSRSSIEEDFADVDFDEVLTENSATGIDVKEKDILDALKAIADKHNYDLRDPEFIDNIDKALAFVKSIRGDKKG